VSWKTLSAHGRVESHHTSREELQGLRAAIERDLRDAALAALSTDNRFGLAYEAALLLAKMVVACAGYRVRGPAAHATTFEAMRLAMGPGIAKTVAYLDRCRRKRNQLSYDVAGVVGEAEAGEILERVKTLRATVEDWIGKKHPSLVP
jgi:hypothetical protein